MIVEYVAAKDSFWCKSYAVAPFTVTRPSRKTIEYHPVVSSGRHRIELPLSEFSLNKGCQYRALEVSLLFAPLSYEPLRKNVLLMDTQSPSFSNNFLKTLKPTQLMPKELNAACFPVNQSAHLADDPNKHWVCYQDQKERAKLIFDLNSNKNSALVLNIRTLSHEEYSSSCFHWAAHHKKECQ